MPNHVVCNKKHAFKILNPFHNRNPVDTQSKFNKIPDKKLFTDFGISLEY